MAISVRFHCGERAVRSALREWLSVHPGRGFLSISGGEGLSYPAVAQRLNEAALPNIVSGRLTELGKHYQSIIRTH